MNRLAELLDDFRDAYGDEPEFDDDENIFTALMEIVQAAEDLVAKDSSQHTSVDSTSGVGLTLFEPFPVEYENVVYDTAFNAFQAQKAPLAERDAFSHADTRTATILGRNCIIDVAVWDVNRVTLMTDILKKQASQNQAFRERILTHAARTDIVHDSMMHDPFWSNEMAGILKSLYVHFEKKRSNKRAKLAAA